MSNQSRDQAGRWASAQAGNAGGAGVAVHTPAAAAATASISSGNSDLHGQALPATAGFSTTDTPTARGASSSIPDGSRDNWGGPSQTDALLNRSGGPKGGGMRGTPVTPAAPPDYAARYRSLGLGSNESGLGVRTQQGPGYRGSDVPGTGVPGPADDSAGGAPGGGGIPGAGAGDAAAGAGAEAAIGADLLPLAEAAL